MAEIQPKAPKSTAESTNISKITNLTAPESQTKNYQSDKNHKPNTAILEVETKKSPKYFARNGTLTKKSNQTHKNHKPEGTRSKNKLPKQHESQTERSNIKSRNQNIL